MQYIFFCNSTYIDHKSYHLAPETSKITPKYEVLKTWVEGSYHNAQLVCYSCDEWTRNSAKVNSTNQGWILASNYQYVMQTNDVARSITLHTDYSKFSSSFIDFTPLNVC